MPPEAHVAPFRYPYKESPPLRADLRTASIASRSPSPWEAVGTAAPTHSAEPTGNKGPRYLVRALSHPPSSLTNTDHTYIQYIHATSRPQLHYHPSLDPERRSTRKSPQPEPFPRFPSNPHHLAKDFSRHDVRRAPWVAAADGVPRKNTAFYGTSQNFSTSAPNQEDIERDCSESHSTQAALSDLLAVHHPIRDKAAHIRVLAKDGIFQPPHAQLNRGFTTPRLAVQISASYAAALRRRGALLGSSKATANFTRSSKLIQKRAKSTPQ